MKGIVQTMLLIICTYFASNAQQRWGVELGISFMNTQNSGSLDVLSTGEIGYEYKSSEYFSSINYSVGLSYKLNESHNLKLLFRNNNFRRIISGNTFSDGGPFYDFMLDEKTLYFQLIGTYTYSVTYKSLLFPLEIGYGLRRLKSEKSYLTLLEDYSSFLFFSTGVDYKITQNMVLGLRGSLQQGITDHLNDDDYWYSSSDFTPVQLSGDIIVRYFF